MIWRASPRTGDWVRGLEGESSSPRDCVTPCSKGNRGAAWDLEGALGSRAAASPQPRKPHISALQNSWTRRANLARRQYEGQEPTRFTP